MSAGEPALLLEHARPAGTAEPTTVAVSGGRILAVGDGADAALDGPVERIDLAGASVLPGLWDAHVHAEQWAVAEGRDAADLLRRRPPTGSCCC